MITTPHGPWSSPPHSTCSQPGGSASVSGEFTRFDAIRVNPRPLRGGRLPVVVGGNSDAALRRAAALADGW
ncbi:LLM class flavin-dependent oxidoreductase [Streptomyces sp. NPDC020362]|uniref:LLM class flavin-dependent oxidoreductase n=1 Tax=unclassified Streptomyces TaxID=2593676 RepID=UPI000B0178F8